MICESLYFVVNVLHSKSQTVISLTLTTPVVIWTKLGRMSEEFDVVSAGGSISRPEFTHARQVFQPHATGGSVFYFIRARYGDRR